MQSPTTIAITGASSGIGAALARAYAAPGITLALCARYADRLGRVAAECEALGAEVLLGVVDVTDPQATAGWLQAIDERSPIDLLIANAGVSAGPDADGLESLETVHTILHTNLEGVFNTLWPIVPAMRARGEGHLAVVSSLAGFMGLPNAPAYSVSKVAAKALGDALRARLRRDGIRVSVICPGFVRTPLTDKNRFYMPFRLTPDKAARRIVKGLGKRKRLIAFPCALAWPVRFLAALPWGLGGWWMGLLPDKRAKT